MYLLLRAIFPITTEFLQKQIYLFLIHFYLSLSFFVCVRHGCARVRVHTCVFTLTSGFQKRALDPLDLELQTFVNSLTWVLETKLWSSESASVLNYQAISLVVLWKISLLRIIDLGENGNWFPVKIIRFAILFLCCYW